MIAGLTAMTGCSLCVAVRRGEASVPSKAQQGGGGCGMGAPASKTEGMQGGVGIGSFHLHSARGAPALSCGQAHQCTHSSHGKTGHLPTVFGQLFSFSYI